MGINRLSRCWEISCDEARRGPVEPMRRGVSRGCGRPKSLAGKQLRLATAGRRRGAGWPAAGNNRVGGVRPVRGRRRKALQEKTFRRDGQARPLPVVGARRAEVEKNRLPTADGWCSLFFHLLRETKPHLAEQDGYRSYLISAWYCCRLFAGWRPFWQAAMPLAAATAAASVVT